MIGPGLSWGLATGKMNRPRRGYPGPNSLEVISGNDRSYAEVMAKSFRGCVDVLHIYFGNHHTLKSFIIEKVLNAISFDVPLNGNN